MYHPDIIEFVKAKTQEGKIYNANISVVIDDEFMRKVKSNETFWTEFNGKRYGEYSARDVFALIVNQAWTNGEPGLQFYDRINDSPYKHDGVTIESSNPCGEQPLPSYGSCNLGSLDLSKFFKYGKFDWELFERAIRVSIRFLDSVIDVNEFPFPKIKESALRYRQIGLGIMGLADLYLLEKVPYGSPEALEILEKIGMFMDEVSRDESVKLGEKLGIPEACLNLPVPRRNITLLTVAPTGTISLLAGCNSGIEPFFSEITQREDKTGMYTLNALESDAPYFRCAVPMTSDKSKEVTWEEHVRTQAAIQKYVDAGVSKTINFPQMTHRETIFKAFFLAWELGCKGITIYRNNSRNVQVLTPKNVSSNLCPVCGESTYKFDGCTKCSKCDWEMCTIG